MFNIFEVHNGSMFGSDIGFIELAIAHSCWPTEKRYSTLKEKQEISLSELKV